jgi:hypothetical protein
MSAGPEDFPTREAARLLRDMAAQPRQSIIWPMYHGGWSSNTVDAFERGASALAAAGDRNGVVSLNRLKADPGDAVAIVAETGGWPHDGALAMLNAAEALEGSRADRPRH